MSEVFIVAEISANHNQNYEWAVQLIHAAKDAGADAVKLQTYTPDTLTIDCGRPEFTVKGGTPWDGKTLYELYSQAFTPWEWQPKLKKLADEIGIELFSTPFDKTAVDFLEEMGVSRYKVASFELVDLPLIAYIASKGKPMIMSTGMATFDEINEAFFAAKYAGATDVTLLKCTSAYPAPPSEMNLQTIPYLRQRFTGLGIKVDVGISDHSLGTAVPITAVALGATVIEKHIMLCGSTPTADSAFSLEPAEFKAMVDSVRVAEKALGFVKIGPSEQERSSLTYRRSLFVVQDIRKGERFTEDNVRSIRPSTGMPPKYLPTILLGGIASQDIERGTPLHWELIA